MSKVAWGGHIGSCNASHYATTDLSVTITVAANASMLAIIDMELDGRNEDLILPTLGGQSWVSWWDLDDYIGGQNWYLLNPPTGSQTQHGYRTAASKKWGFIMLDVIGTVRAGTPIRDSSQNKAYQDTTMDIAVTKCGGMDMALFAIGSPAGYATPYSGQTNIGNFYVEAECDGNGYNYYSLSTKYNANGTCGYTAPNDWNMLTHAVLKANPPVGGFSVFFKKWQDLLDDVRQARIPPELLLRRYREAVQI